MKDISSILLLILVLTESRIDKRRNIYFSFKFLDCSCLSAALPTQWNPALQKCLSFFYFLSFFFSFLKSEVELLDTALTTVVPSLTAG